jgi:hypothetical protein
MLRDLIGSEHVNDDGHEDGNPSKATASHFKHLTKEAKCDLYPSCTNFSRLSFVIKLLYVKSYYRVANSAFLVFFEDIIRSFPIVRNYSKII